MTATAYPAATPAVTGRAVRWPQMRRARTESSCVPDGAGRRRRHERSNLAAAHRPNRTRDLYRRLIDRLAPTFDPGALIVLLALVDLQDAGETLNDVVITQDQLVDRLAGDDPRWGMGVYSIRRRLHWLADHGWISIEDVRLPEPGWQINSYRFRVPDFARPIWVMLSHQAEDARRKGLQAHQRDLTGTGRPEPVAPALSPPLRPPQRPLDEPDDNDAPPAPAAPERTRAALEQMRQSLRNRAGP